VILLFAIVATIVQADNVNFHFAKLLPPICNVNPSYVETATKLLRYMENPNQNIDLSDLVSPNLVVKYNGVQKSTTMAEFESFIKAWNNAFATTYDSVDKSFVYESEAAVLTTKSVRAKGADGAIIDISRITVPSSHYFSFTINGRISQVLIIEDVSQYTYLGINPYN
jgi:hypothetical protein